MNSVIQPARELKTILLLATFISIAGCREQASDNNKATPALKKAARQDRLTKQVVNCRGIRTWMINLNGTTLYIPHTWFWSEEHQGSSFKISRIELISQLKDFKCDVPLTGPYNFETLLISANNPEKEFPVSYIALTRTDTRANRTRSDGRLTQSLAQEKISRSTATTVEGLLRIDGSHEYIATPTKDPDTWTYFVAPPATGRISAGRTYRAAFDGTSLAYVWNTAKISRSRWLEMDKAVQDVLIWLTLTPEKRSVENDMLKEW